MSTPTARNPHTVTLCWTPDQNSGRVSAYPSRAPLHAILGLLRAGESPQVVAEEHGLSDAEVSVLVALNDDLRSDGMTVDGDLLRDVIADAVPRFLIDTVAHQIADAALDGAVRAGMTVIHGPNATPREVAG